ncbi:hypothetical protein KSS87_008334, partial [Heliosperma pusillum]
ILSPQPHRKCQAREDARIEKAMSSCQWSKLWRIEKVVLWTIGYSRWPDSLMEEKKLYNEGGSGLDPKLTGHFRFRSFRSRVNIYRILGDEFGEVSILKYSPEDGKLVQMPYRISPHIIAAEVVVFKGDKDLLIKGHLSDSSRKLDVDPLNNALEDMYEKEISALCWASSIGSILAVGYIDGDILLWDLRAPFKCNKTGDSFNDVVKLQLSSAEKRLPVIILHWCEVNVSQNSSSGQLFVYGGCEIGSEEALTVVSMKWSPGMETLKTVSRVDLAVHSAFADMVFLSSLGTPAKGQHDGLFVLTRPGELQFYDMKFLSSLASQHERKSHASGVKFHVAIPTTDPQMTATKLSSHAYGGNVSAWLLDLEITSFGSTLSPGKRTKWPLTGGTRNEVSSADEKPEKRIYIAGYKDGTVRVWDVTKSTFSLVTYLEGQVPGIASVGSNISVTSLDFCESTMNLAVGSECGAVRVYSLTSGDGTKLHWVKHSEQKVYDMPPSKGPQCKAVFSLVNARVQSLQFTVSGSKLAVGFESSHVAVLDMQSLSVLFLTNSVASSTSPIISAILKTCSDVYESSEGSKHMGSKNTEQLSTELIFTVTQDSKVNVLDSRTGSIIGTRPLHLKKEHKAISIYVLGKLSVHKDISLIHGDDKPVCKVNLAKSCCWASILRKDDKIGLILAYQSGTIEIRLLPSLELLLESSINSAIRWNFRSNMENLTSSTDQGLISLVNGSEVVFFSLSTGESETIFRESLPLLHDKVMSTAADAAISYSIKHKKQVAASGILGGIVKGFKKESNNTKDPPSLTNFLQLERIFSHPVVTDSSFTTLEDKEEEEDKELDIDDIEIDEPILPAATSSNQVLNHVLSIAAKGKATGKLKDSLFEGKHMDMKPKTRTPEEIMAAYRGAEPPLTLLSELSVLKEDKIVPDWCILNDFYQYASAAAERAKNKLLERQEKLEVEVKVTTEMEVEIEVVDALVVDWKGLLIGVGHSMHHLDVVSVCRHWIYDGRRWDEETRRVGQRTEDLRNEAEDFASMANELVKTMESRKRWWKI